MKSFTFSGLPKHNDFLDSKINIYVALHWPAVVNLTQEYNENRCTKNIYVSTVARLSQLFITLKDGYTSLADNPL